ncbi:MAG: hypothetical protein MN733_31090 [Nitrososphaera sp.]|nr:hypothetical protein [Nitrososphaera sp.]
MADEQNDWLTTLLQGDSLGEALTGRGEYATPYELRHVVETAETVKAALSCIKDLSWINPAAILIPRHPTHFLERDDQKRWNEALHFASYLPIALDGLNQEALLDAYHKANYPELPVNVDAHISATLIKLLSGEDSSYSGGCFLATFNESDRNIYIKKCCETVCNDTFCGQHYEALYKLSNTKCIAFVPHSLLTRISTTESLYQSYLVGSYLCIKQESPFSCACKFSPEILEWSDKLSQVMYLKARRKANQELSRALEDHLQQLDKYRRMYDLLSAPLMSLTNALKKTEQDSQELRAILYDPMDAIFSSQPLIAQLFDPRVQLQIPNNRQISIEHQPTGYDLSGAQWVLAAALARFMGKGLEGDTSSTALDKVIDHYVKATVSEGAKKDPFNEMGGRLIHVLQGNTWRSVKTQVSNPDALYTYLGRLKERFFTAYKPDEARRPLWWMVLSAFLSDVELTEIMVNGKPFKGIIGDVKNKLLVVASRANPMATHGHLIEFLVGIIEQHKKSEPEALKLIARIVLCDCPIEEGGEDVDLETPKSVTLQIETSKDKWIDDPKKLCELLRKQISYRRLRVRPEGQHGDFYGPFVKLIQRMPDDCLEHFTVSDDNGLEIKPTRAFAIIFQAQRLQLTSVAESNT